jgi:hypothetical protein
LYVGRSRVRRSVSPREMPGDASSFRDFGAQLRGSGDQFVSAFGPDISVKPYSIVVLLGTLIYRRVA